MAAILHTLGRYLSLHLSLLGIVSDVGINKNGNWQLMRSVGKFLYR
jgi:hypothetical protein